MLQQYYSLNVVRKTIYYTKYIRPKGGKQKKLQRKIYFRLRCVNSFCFFTFLLLLLLYAYNYVFFFLATYCTNIYVNLIDKNRIFW